MDRNLNPESSGPHPFLIAQGFGFGQNIPRAYDTCFVFRDGDDFRQSIRAMQVLQMHLSPNVLRCEKLYLTFTIPFI